jgi:hypothetical protein
MPEQVREEELNALRAEVLRLRRALEATQSQPERRGLFELDPEAPGLSGLWRGERGLAWQLFVQAVVAVNAVLAVVAGIAIIH